MSEFMSPEDMAHYLMDFCHCHLATGNGGDGECRLGVPDSWDF